MYMDLIFPLYLGEKWDSWDLTMLLYELKALVFCNINGEVSNALKIYAFYSSSMFYVKNHVYTILSFYVSGSSVNVPISTKREHVA